MNNNYGNNINQNNNQQNYNNIQTNYNQYSQNGTYTQPYYQRQVSMNNYTSKKKGSSGFKVLILILVVVLVGLLVFNFSYSFEFPLIFVQLYMDHQ